MIVRVEMRQIDGTEEGNYTTTISRELKEETSPRPSSEDQK
jgi:hypothetical protein